MNKDKIKIWAERMRGELWRDMQDNVTNDEAWYKAKGGHVVIEKLLDYIQALEKSEKGK